MKRIVYLVLLLAAAVFAKDANDTFGNFAISVNQNPIGKWQSVDFVRNINDFRPGRRAAKIDLFLKDIEFMSDGTTSKVWTWSENLLYNAEDKTKEKFQIREANDTAYLFFPWPDGQKLYYYVLKRVSSEEPPSAEKQQQPDLTPENCTIADLSAFYPPKAGWRIRGYPITLFNFLIKGIPT